MSGPAQSPSLNARIGIASAVVKDVDAYSCVVQIQAGEVVKGGTYLFKGFSLQFLAARIGWIRGTTAGLFFRHPIQSEPLSQIRAAVSLASDASARVELQRVDLAIDLQGDLVELPRP
jgi:hypothetical protein